MLDDPFSVSFFCIFGVYQPLFYPEKHASHLQTVDPF